jgi:ATP-binding cassette, subfamily C, bacteriocin exporter
MINKRIRESFAYQRDEKDCGAACLLSILRYHETDSGIDHLNYLSGASTSGVSLYGLAKAASSFGLVGEGFEATIEDLKSLSDPCILHTTIQGIHEHFVVLYGIKKGRYLIGDPEVGIVSISEEELLSMWKTGVLMTFTKTKEFKPTASAKKKNNAWLFNLIISDTNKLISTLFLGIVISSLSLSTAIYTQALIDVILPKGNLQLLILSVIGWALLLLTNTFILYFRGIIIAQWEYNFSTSILASFFSTLLTLPKTFFDSKKKGDLIARMNDVQRIQSILNQIVNESIIHVLIITCSVIVLYYYSPIASLIAVLNLPLQFCIVYLFNEKLHNLQKNTVRKYGINEANYVDVLEGIEVIKSTTKESYFHQSVVSRYKDFKSSEYNLNKTAILYRIVSSGLGIFVTISTVLHSALLYYQGNLILGQLLAILSIVFLVISSTSNLVLLNVSLQSGKVALQRLYECLEQSPEKHAKSVSSEPVFEGIDNISVDNLSFGFPSCDFLFENASLNVRKGESIAILGENGCGKSTFINVLLKFFEYESGSIIINEKIDFKNIPPERWRKFVSIVPQKTKIFNSTLWENIALGTGSVEEVESFCKNMGFSDIFETLPLKYETLLGEAGINISGGQQQLVAMARALYRKPSLLLLDEATSSFDPHTEAIAQNAIKKTLLLS